MKKERVSCVTADCSLFGMQSTSGTGAVILYSTLNTFSTRHGFSLIRNYVILSALLNSHFDTLYILQSVPCWTFFFLQSESDVVITYYSEKDPKVHDELFMSANFICKQKEKCNEESDMSEQRNGRKASKIAFKLTLDIHILSQFYLWWK